MRKKEELQKIAKVFNRFLNQVDFGEWELVDKHEFQIDNNWANIDIEHANPIKASAKNFITLFNKESSQETMATFYVSLNYENRINPSACTYFIGGLGHPINTHVEEFNTMLDAEELENSLATDKAINPPKPKMKI